MAKFRKEEKRRKADELRAAASLRTPEEQIARLDSMFGPGQGAKKERAKLAERIKARDSTSKNSKKKKKE